MKKLFLPILVLLIGISCTDQNDTTKKANEALIKKYVKAVEEDDFKTMELLLADDYLGLGPSVGDSIRKKEAIENWKKNTEELYEKITYSKARIIAVNVLDGPDKGEWVSNWAELKITYKHGRGQVTVWSNTVYKLQDGKIVKSYTFYNEADVLCQLGYVFVNSKNLKKLNYNEDQ